MLSLKSTFMLRSTVHQPFVILKRILILLCHMSCFVLDAIDERRVCNIVQFPDVNFAVHACNFRYANFAKLV